MTTDPVCGMAVDQTDTPSLEVAGTAWWFCSQHCRDEFEADPARFLPHVAPLMSAHGTGGMARNPYRP